jgi:hypothetical protein
MRKPELITHGEQKELKAAADAAYQIYATSNNLNDAVETACKSGSVNYPEDFIKLYLKHQHPELAQELEKKEALQADLMIIQAAEVQNDKASPGQVLCRPADP